MTPTMPGEMPIDRIRKRLAEYYEPHEIDVWLDSPQVLLGNRTPRVMIGMGAEYEVERLLDQIDQGVYL